MGLNYSELKNAIIDCPICGESIDTIWQFYYGTVGGGQIRKYNLGNEIKWEYGRNIGSKELPLVYATAYSVSEPTCSSCEFDFKAELIIRNNVIEKIRFLTSAVGALRELYFESEERIPYFPPVPKRND